MSACSASVLSRSRRPLASARSSSVASRFACAEPPPLAAAPAGFACRSTGLAPPVRLAGGRAGTAARRAAFAVLGEDINLVAFLHDLVLAQLEPAVRHAFARLHVVFVAVPRTDEMHFAIGEVESLRGLVGQQPLLDLGDGETLASGAALVQAEIAVGVELALVPEYADLVVSGEDDAAVSVLELGDLPDILL